MNVKKFWKRTLYFIIFWAILTIVFLLDYVLELGLVFPKNSNGWLLFLLFGPLLWLIVNIVFEYLIGKPISAGLDKLGEKKIRTINKVLASVIILPIIIVLLYAIFISFYE